MALLDVQVARQCRQHQRLDVLSNAEVQAVDVGQLLAVLVDLPEVRITLHHHTGGAAGVGLGDHPRVDGRFFGVAPARRDFDVAALGTEQLRPVRHVGRFGLVGGLRVVLGVELAAVVFGKQRRVLAQRRGHLLEEQGVRCGEGELDGHLIDLADFTRLAGNHQCGGHRLVEL